MLLTALLSPRVSIAAKIVAFEKAWNRVYKLGDKRGLDLLLDDHIVLINDDGTVQTKAAFLAGVKGTTSQQQQVAPESITVPVFGNAAIATGVFRAKGVEAGKRRFTARAIRRYLDQQRRKLGVRGHQRHASSALRLMIFRCDRRRVLLPLLTALLIAGTIKLSFPQAPARTPASGDSAEAHLGKGYDALRQDRYDLATSEFRAALALDPTLVLRARFPLAVALFELHRLPEARQEFEAVRRETGDHPNVLYYLGRLDLEARNFEGAIHHLRQAAAQPPFPDTAYYLGFAYFKQGDLASAEKWLNTAEQSNARDARIPYQLGLVYHKQGREEEAKKAQALSDQLRQRDDKESRLRLECAQKLDQGLTAQARAICEQLYDPNNADKLTELGTIYGQHGELEAALRPFERAAQLAPQAPQMQYNLALAYYQLNRFEEARAPLADALRRWPDLFPLNALYGAVLLKLGENLPAYEALRHALQLNPQDSGTADLLYTTVVGLARKSQDARRYSDSLRYLAEAAKLRPNDPEPHRRMAEIYTVTGRPAQARAEQQEAERLMKNFGGIP